MLEEALEAYQSATLGLPSEEMRTKAHSLVDYVMTRLAGNLAQECGGVGLTLLALCEAAGISADAEEERELARVLSKPLEHFRERNKVKNDAGFAVDGSGNSFSQNKAIRSKFPDPDEAAAYMEVEFLSPATANDTFRQIKARMRAFQRDTINTLADCLVREAGRLEAINGFVTVADMRRQAQALRDYAETLVPRAPEATR
jgi:hypothetical protein